MEPTLGNTELDAYVAKFLKWYEHLTILTPSIPGLLSVLITDREGVVLSKGWY
jgi:hypothetical protein